VKNYKSSLLALILFGAVARQARADESATISDRGNPLSRAKSAEELAVPRPAPMISSQASPAPQAAPKAAALATPDEALAPPTSRVAVAPAYSSIAREAAISREKPVRVTKRLIWPWRIATLIAACGLLFLSIRR
jgi:hypothetical protein